jgi:hypothetical protein
VSAQRFIRFENDADCDAGFNPANDGAFMGVHFNFNTRGHNHLPAPLNWHCRDSGRIADDAEAIKWPRRRQPGLPLFAAPKRRSPDYSRQVGFHLN